jgi:hypothetical protein
VSALAQSIATQLGAAGGAYANARDTQTEEKNKVQQTQFEQAQRVREYLEQKRMDDLQAEVARANMARQQQGTWDAVGSPIKNSAGGYSVIERNTATGAVRTTALDPSFKPENKYQEELDELEAAYGRPLPQSLRDHFIESKMGQNQPTNTAFEAGLAAWKRDHPGKEPTLSDINKIRLATTGKTAGEGGAGSGDDLSNWADAVGSRAVPLTEVPSKIRGPLLKYMKDNGIKLPNQLPAGVESTLTERSIATERAIQLLDDMSQHMDLLQSIPSASLVLLAKSPDNLENWLGRIWGSTFTTKHQQDVDDLTADLKSFNEALNVLRAPLGATTFRGKEGLNMLMGNTISPLSQPGVNIKTLSNTRATLQALLDGYYQTLGAPSTDAAPSGGPQPAPPKGATMKVPGSDGKLHWSDGKRDLGVVQ